ncbi:MAG TPA: DUF2795 domain-containing protein [Frankiaceae bacterium]|jgi:uncharacterized protein (DUF885 family)|nr:DUF2795 domain-containing protein [Frankiaceae bacterium]
MERSNKHGFRVDDAMSSETESLTRGAPIESRVEEWREAEPSGDDQPVADGILNGDARDTNGAPAHDELELRSELAKRLRTSVFPANRQVLEDVATEENAPGHILDLIRRLPDGRTFENTADVWRALGGAVEHRGSTTA